MSARKKLFAVAALSTNRDDNGGYNLLSSLVLAKDKSAAIKLALRGIPRRFRNHEFRIAEATPEFLASLAPHFRRLSTINPQPRTIRKCHNRT